MPSLLHKHSIFESTAQHIDEIDPSTIEPLLDRCILKEVEEDSWGLIYIPPMAQGKQLARMGVVLAVGPGDKYTERLTSRNTFDSDGRPPREFHRMAQRLPMYVRVGDKVLYDRRNEQEFYICGERIGILNQEQSILAILEGKVIIPLYDRLVVKRTEEGEGKVGSIIIPETAKEKPQQGTVIAAGKGKRDVNGQLIPLDVQVGDLILFGKYTGSEVKIDGEEYLMMREDEVYGRVPAKGASA